MALLVDLCQAAPVGDNEGGGMVNILSRAVEMWRRTAIRLGWMDRTRVVQTRYLMNLIDLAGCRVKNEIQRK